MAQLSDLSDLVNVINTVKGKKQTQKTSGGTTTETTQTNVSDQGVNQIIQNILSGQGGVRTVGGAARSAGMYDSTTEDLMLNDLYSRAANQAELARSPTTRSTTTPSQTTTISEPGAGLGTTALTLAGTSALSSILKGEVPFAGAMESIRGVGGGGGALASIFGGSGGAAAGTAVPGGFMSQLGADSVGQAAGTAGAAAMAPSASGGFMSQIGGLGNVASGAGGFLSGLMQEEEALDSPGKLLATLGPAAAIGGPMGAAVAGLGSVLGSAISGGSIQDTIAGIPIVGDVLDPVIGGIRSIGREIGDAVGTVICTALVERGLISRKQYRQALLHMHRVSPATLKGYHYWAVPVAQKIRAGHKGWTKFWLPFVESRISLLLSQQSTLDHIKNPLGTATKYLIEPGCYLIGKYLSWKEVAVGKGVSANG